MRFELYHDLSRVPSRQRMAIGDDSPPPDIERKVRSLMASGIAGSPHDYPMRLYAVQTTRAAASSKGKTEFAAEPFGDYDITLVSNPNAGTIDDGAGGSTLSFTTLPDGTPPFADARVRAADHLSGPIVVDLVASGGNPPAAPTTVRIVLHLAPPEYDYRAAMFTDVLGIGLANIKKRFEPAPIGADTEIFFALVQYFGKFTQSPAYVGPPIPVPLQIIDIGQDVVYGPAKWTGDPSITFTTNPPASDTFRGATGPADGSTDVTIPDPYSADFEGDFEWVHPGTPPAPYPKLLRSDRLTFAGLQPDISVEVRDAASAFQPATNVYDTVVVPVSYGFLPGTGFTILQVRIDNSGLGTLRFTGIPRMKILNDEVTGFPDPEASIKVIAPPVPELAAGQDMITQIRIDGAGQAFTGAWSIRLRIESNDPSDPIFDVAVSGTGPIS